MHKYKYTIVLILTFIGAFAVGKLTVVNSLVELAVQTNEILYTFVTGALYSFSFTAGLAVLMFSKITVDVGQLVSLALLAAFGGLLADLLIFRFIKDVLLHELGHHAQALLEKATKAKITKILLGVLGAIIIASPFPDEIGLTFMGVSKIKFWELVVLTFAIDFVGALIIISSVATLV